MYMNIAQKGWDSIPAKPYVFGYLALYGLTLWVLARYVGFDPGDAIGVFLTLGLGFTFLAWLFTLKSRAEAPVLRRPGVEMGAVFAYLVIFAFGFLGYGFSWLKQEFTDPRAHDLAVMLAKLIAMVLIPALLLKRLGHPLRETLKLNFRWKQHGLVLLGLGLLMLLFQAFGGQGLHRLSALNPSTASLLWGVPLCFLYLCIDTGLTEEYLFRVVLQTRLSAWLKSETAGVVVMALLFGLAHAPGYYLRGAFAADGMSGSQTLLLSVGYTVVITSVVGFMFGMLWARTRSLALIVMLHALTDLIPNLAEFIQTWSGIAAPVAN